MGQIAEDIVDGSCCADCGQYFQHQTANGIMSHGYPVLCKECYDDYKSDGIQPDLDRATADTMGGLMEGYVAHFLSNRENTNPPEHKL